MDRVGRPLGPDVSASCPNAWHDTNEVFEELRAENEAALAELYCYKLTLIRSVVGRADLQYAREYDEVRTELEARKLTEAVAERCPGEWQDAMLRRESVREETTEASKQPEVEETEQQQAEPTATPTPRAVTVNSPSTPTVLNPIQTPSSAATLSSGTTKNDSVQTYEHYGACSAYSDSD